jgi:hypothetical protein
MPVSELEKYADARIRARNESSRVLNETSSAVMGRCVEILALMGWYEEGETRLMAVLDDSTDDEFERKLGAIEANQQQAKP